MALTYGVTSHFDKKFAKHLNLKLRQDGGDTTIYDDGESVTLSSIFGDCTAISIYTNEMCTNSFAKILPHVLKYAGFNGKITVFFSRVVKKSHIQDELAVLRAHNAVGISLQYSNRCDPAAERVIITGVFKITNPYVMYGYDSLHPDMNATVRNNFEKIMKTDQLIHHEDFTNLNKEFGIDPFRY